MPEQTKKKRRVVKRAETVREKTEKAAMPKQEKKRGVVSLAFRYITWPFRWLGRLIAKLGRPLGKFKVLRFIGRILWPSYFRNSWRELKQVTWPTRRETWQLTLAVILFSAVFGAIIAAVDWGLDKVFRKLILE